MLFGRPRRRWENYIKMDVREIGFENVDWIRMLQSRNQWRTLASTAMGSGFRKRQGIPSPAEQLLASKEWPFCTKLFSQLCVTN
jgi:hypothetical protein